MTKRTRLFVVIAAGILVVGLGTGLLASYMGIQNLTLIGGNGLQSSRMCPPMHGCSPLPTCARSWIPRCAAS